MPSSLLVCVLDISGSIWFGMMVKFSIYHAGGRGGTSLVCPSVMAAGEVRGLGLTFSVPSLGQLLGSLILGNSTVLRILGRLRWILLFFCSWRLCGDPGWPLLICLICVKKVIWPFLLLCLKSPTCCHQAYILFWQGYSLTQINKPFNIFVLVWIALWFQKLMPFVTLGLGPSWLLLIWLALSMEMPDTSCFILVGSFYFSWKFFLIFSITFM